MRADAEAAIAAGETWSGLMRRWLHRWYGEDGLLVLDPQDAQLKTFGAALWAKEFEGGGVLAALQGSTAMDGPAHVRENSVFWIDATQGRKGVIRTEDGRWKAGDIVLDEPEEGWLSWASENAMSCSPGVLLRPLYQELLLQSAAVILGPGEWRYWHQLPRAFAHHGLAFPALRLRDHGVVVSAGAVACGWTLKDGWLHDEVWDRWVLDKWMSEWGEGDSNAGAGTCAMEPRCSGLGVWHVARIERPSRCVGSVHGQSMEAMDGQGPEVVERVKGA